MSVSQLFQLGSVDKVVMHSLDMSLYQVSVELDGESFYITDNKGAFLRAFNLLDLQKQVRGIHYQKMVLRQTSAYDEMIGLAGLAPGASNQLEVDISDNDLS